MSLKYKHTAKTLAEWEALNPVIVNNEIVIEKDTNRLKIGDGQTPYMSLQYACYENLNGTNYIMVYAIGTPEENAAELQAAYDEAKKMPRYLGEVNELSVSDYYKGQTFYNNASGIYSVMIYDELDVTGIPTTLIDIITEEEAKSVRTTLIVAPGKYTFTTPLAVDTEYIDIVSLTGNADVLLNGINVTANDTFIKGINCADNVLSLQSTATLDNCRSSNNLSPVGVGGAMGGTLINCEFNGDGLGSDNFTGLMIGCSLNNGVYPTILAGHISYCINVDGSAATNQ